MNGREQLLYAYVIPGQQHDLILGNNWLIRQNATLHPGRQEIKFEDMTVKGRPDAQALSLISRRLVPGLCWRSVTAPDELSRL